MKRDSNGLRTYKETCLEVMTRASNCCEILIDGKRCGRFIPDDDARAICFAHTESRNGKSDGWVCNPSNILFTCAEHHIREHMQGEKLIGVDYDDSDGIVYVPDEL